MSEQLSYELNLIDVVSAPSKRAAESLRALDRQAQKVQDSLDIKSSSKAFDKIAKDAQKLRDSMSFAKDIQRNVAALNKINSDPKGYQMLIKAQRDLAAARRKGETPEHDKHGFGGGMKEGLGLGKHDNVSGAAFLGGFVAEVGSKIVESLIDGVKEAIGLFTEGVKFAFEEAGKKEALNLGYKLSLGTEEGEKSLGDINRFAGKTGFDDDKIAEMMLPLLRAGMGQDAARTAFATAGDVAAGKGKGGDIGTISAVLEGFEHILLKGGVQDKKLVGMGVKLEPFYASLAKKEGVSVEEAKKRASEGKIDSQRLLNTITEGVNARQGGIAGTGTEAYSKTFQGRMAHITNLPADYLKSISESPEWSKLSDKLGQAFEALSPDSPRGKEITHELINLFERISKAIQDMLQPGAFDGFINGIKSTISAIDSLATGLGKIVDSVKSATDLMNKGLELGIGRNFAGGNTGDAADAAKNLMAHRAMDLASIPENPGLVSSSAKQLGISEDNMRLMIKAMRGAAPIHVETHVNVQGKVDESNAHTVGVSAGDAAAKRTERAMQEGGG